uniref:COMM domain containing 9 n=1 Tax=Anser brachyrhynchus TaxID=132585 RepID=A0A8B9IAC6_9AVES
MVKQSITSCISKRALQLRASVKFYTGCMLIWCKTLSCILAPIIVAAACFTDVELRLKYFTAFTFSLGASKHARNPRKSTAPALVTAGFWPRRPDYSARRARPHRPAPPRTAPTRWRRGGRGGAAPAPAEGAKMAALREGEFAALQSLLKLVSALHSLTRHVVYRGLTRAEDILALFPENFHQNLKNLLTKIILENISAWRNEAQASQISLPRLVDMDWRVDIKTSSDTINRMAVPTCLLQLKIQEDAALCGNSPVVSALTVELSKETLDTMLEGLGRIRDQLSAVANK